MMPQNKWFVGINWASEAHQAWIIDADGASHGDHSFPHDGSGLAAMATWILTTTKAAAGDVSAAIEVPHGPVVESLMEHGFAVHAINPKQLDRFRDRFSPAGAKDDRRDALVLADALRTNPRSLRRLAPIDPLIVELREHNRIAEELSRDQVRLVNRLRKQLWRYDPQVITLAKGDVAEPWILNLWALAPTPQKARRLRRSTVDRVLKERRIRRIGAEEGLTCLREPAITVAPGTVEAATAHIRSLIDQIAVIRRLLAQANRQIDSRLKALADSAEAAGDQPGQNQEQRDATILSSMPGVGRIVLATLLAEASDALRRRDDHALRCLCAVAPVTRRSGKSTIVVRRLAAHKRLRNATCHWARTAMQHDPVSRAKDTVLRARGHKQARALRSIADRLLAVACAMLKNRTIFDPGYPKQARSG